MGGMIPFPPAQQGGGPGPQNFDPGAAMAGSGPDQLAQMQQQSQMEQSAGMLENLKDLSAGLTQAQDFVTTIASQYPGAAQYARTVIEALDVANKGIVDLLTAVISQSNVPEPMAPKYLG